MVDPKIFEPFNDQELYEAGLLGLMHAFQALAVATLDTDEKRGKMQQVIEALSEAALQSNLEPARRERYLIALSSAGVAAVTAPKL